MSGQTEMSVEELLPLAEKYPSAQYQIGCCYSTGTGGVHADPVKAAEWLTKAAEQGYAAAQFRLGRAYLKGIGVQKDFVKAAEWLRLAADQGLAPAQRDLGMSYETGIGVDRDLAEAARWYRKAADQGDGYGQYLLAECYGAGDGVEKDDAKAFELHLKAAHQGIAESQYRLFLFYLTGQGGAEKNPAEATWWLLNSAKQGNEDALKAVDTYLLPALPAQAKAGLTRQQIIDRGLEELRQLRQNGQ